VSVGDLENWDPLQPREVARILEGLEVPWWIAGGFAIDAFVGRFDRRPHEDIDVGLLARDQEALRTHLVGWELYCADPPGTLRLWCEGEHLEEPIHDVWCRPQPGAPWRLALVLNPSEGDFWIYRRDIRIRRPMPGFTFERDGIRYAAPEVQLLFKAKGLRAKDERDFDDAAPFLDADQRAWLRSALQLTSPAHPWLARL
jgi:Aminoglycoside-2''-adenylyltransferase